MKIKICIGSSCHIKGSRQVVETFQSLAAANALGDKVEMSGTFCMGNCKNGVCVDIDGTVYSVSPETAGEFFEEHVASKFKED